MAALFAALALAVAMGAYAAHTFARHRFLESKKGELGAIADLKVAQIVAWRSERLADARVAARDPLLAAAARDWLAAGARPEAGAALQSRLDTLRDEYGYERMTLLKADGEPGLTAPKTALGRVESDELTRQARGSTAVSFIDLHRPDGGKEIHLELVAPLRLLGDPHSRPVAFLEFLIDPRRSLYPLIQSWPTTSRSGETLLVRREGNFVVFLNELRHRKDTALSLHLPVSQPDLPAAQAVQGKEGIFEGRDYRGEPVLAALRRVPDSPWFLTTKVDYDEIVAPLARDAWLTTLLALALIALAGLTALPLMKRERKVSDAELRESEARYRGLFEHSLSGVALHEIVLDAEGRAIDHVFLEVNPAFEQLTGLKRDEVLGRRVTEVLPGIEKGPFIEIYGRVVATGQGARFEEFAAPLARHYEVVAFKVDAGRFATIFNDATERKRAAESLHLQSAALEAAANAVLITDYEGRVVWVNDAFYVLTGWSLDECRGLTPRILKSGRYDRSFYDELWRTIRRGDVWQREMVNRRKGGELYVEDQTITPVRDERGEITHFVAIKIDVTERKRAEEAILKEKGLSEAIVGSLPGVFCLFDRTGRFLRWNRSLETATGYSAREIAAMQPLDFFAGEDRTLIEETIAKVFETGTAEAEAAIASKEGRRIPYHFLAARTGVDGVPCCIATGIDLTARKHLEAQLLQSQRIEAIGQLAGGVAHDFNNILGVIMGYGELAQRQLGTEHPVRARVDQMVKAAERAAGLTRQLLAFSRKQVMQPRLLDLNAIVADVAARCWTG